MGALKTIKFVKLTKKIPTLPQITQTKQFILSLPSPPIIRHICASHSSARRCAQGRCMRRPVARAAVHRARSLLTDSVCSAAACALRFAAHPAHSASSGGGRITHFFCIFFIMSPTSLFTIAYLSRSAVELYQNTLVGAKIQSRVIYGESG